MFAQLVELAKRPLKIIPAATPVPAAAAAASLAKQIITTCEEVSYQRVRAQAIGQKCLQLEDALEESLHGMDATSFQQHADESRSLLGQIHKRAQRWRGCHHIMRWYLRPKMNAEMDRFTQELDIALKSFSTRSQADASCDVDGVDERAEYHFAETRDLLLKMAEEQADIKRMITSLLQAGFADASVLVRNGQMALKQMKEESATTTSAPTDQSSVQASSDPNVIQNYRNMQVGLARLVRETGILPPERCLDGDVRLVVAGGSTSGKGIWLEETEVALKTLRHIKVDNPTAQENIVHEIDIWSKLSNDHILQFYGYVTDLGPHICLVSPWLNNGNVLDYVKAHPDADKMHLLRGAAEGLRYLHTQEIIHGNVKCSNIMVSDSGEARISDFGMANMIEDMTRTPFSRATGIVSGSIRWLAPEVLEESHLSKASDTYSFGMTILELLTGKHPYAEHRSDAIMFKVKFIGIVPRRPESSDVQQWLSDDLWALLERCWAYGRESRPTMEDVVLALTEKR